MEHSERLDAVTVERSPVTINTDQDVRATFGSVSTFYDLGSTPQGNWEGSDGTPLSAHLAAGRGFRIPDEDLTALVEKVISSHSTERERHMSLGHCLGAAIESDREGSITRIFSTLGSTPPRHPTLASLLLVYLLTRSSPLEYKGLLEASAACAGDREDELTTVDAYRIRLATLVSPLATELLDDTDNAHSMSLSFVNFINHIVRGSAQASREAAKRERIEGGWRDIYDISELIGKPQLYPPDANREFTDVGSLFFPVVDPIEKVVYEANDGFHYVNDKVMLLVMFSVMESLLD
ncbi:hypothetical protein Pmar_PMAR010067 [Perkinsus marinus ATCC 50983]|uniref:Uncharacterized protein n=1 Tax=Perkinsus marinus (strain ATCC 50983 / TXsc) TaxID=423536 RepID=C5K4R0_PERM5|nr:hypothetical protein Pmar_PMAR010067 [Perkinsus marinus ATCC 50983]EER20332.1 hypothetical protein Pmar_PMAR010067 [Perkinsus marinus ATCC 50983]|eukprot:XP_002788536.1 hypothetical protein Pmar_PMAR010067 [Perkinsus marinus ATCC 50983]